MPRHPPPPTQRKIPRRRVRSREGRCAVVRVRRQRGLRQRGRVEGERSGRGDDPPRVEGVGRGRQRAGRGRTDGHLPQRRPPGRQRRVQARGPAVRPLSHSLPPQRRRWETIDSGFEKVCRGEGAGHEERRGRAHRRRRGGHRRVGHARQRRPGCPKRTPRVVQGRARVQAVMETGNSNHSLGTTSQETS